jgi:hypothetical protein
MSSIGSARLKTVVYVGTDHEKFMPTVHIMERTCSMVKTITECENSSNCEDAFFVYLHALPI